MKSQEIIEYEVYDLGDGEPKVVTESFEEAQKYFEKGFAVHELHTVRWQPLPRTKTSTTIVIEW